MTATLTDSFEIVSATLEDLPSVARNGRAFYEEGQLPGDFNPSTFCSTWEKFIASGLGKIFALKKGTDFCGALGCLVYPDPNDGATVAMETFWYVSKQFRGRGLLLLNAFEEWAKENNAARCMIAHYVHLNADVLGRIYRRRGFSPLEVHYIKTL